MVARFCSIILLLLICTCQQTAVNGSFETESKLIDQIVQYVWDPSALVRFWTGLDQLYQIASSYKEVAIKLITLPFRDPDQHRVHFNGRDRALGRVKSESIPKHLDRIAQTYRRDPPRRPKIRYNKNHFDFLDTNFHRPPRFEGLPSFNNYKKRIPDFHSGHRDIIEAIRNAELRFPEAYPSYLPQQNTLIQSNDAMNTNYFVMNPALSQPQVKLKMFLNLMSQLNPNSQTLKKQID